MIPACGPQTVFLASSVGLAKLASAILGAFLGWTSLGKSRQVGGNQQSWGPGYWQPGQSSLG
eukprot:1252120-Karenia_brevis.AAC.1